MKMEVDWKYPWKMENSYVSRYVQHTLCVDKRLTWLYNSINESVI